MWRYGYMATYLFPTRTIFEQITLVIHMMGIACHCSSAVNFSILCPFHAGHEKDLVRQSPRNHPVGFQDNRTTRQSDAPFFKSGRDGNYLVREHRGDTRREGRDLYTHTVLLDKTHTHTHSMRAETRRVERKERVRGGVERKERCIEKPRKIEKGRGMTVVL